MKRTIKLKAGNVTVEAKLVTKNYALDRSEIERVVTELADNLMRAVEGLPYNQGAPISRQKLEL